MSTPDEPIENEFLIGGNERRAIILLDYSTAIRLRVRSAVSMTRRARVTIRLRDP